MIDRSPLWTLGFLMLAVVANGCASPYTYYCDDQCGPYELSGRYADCGAEPCGTCGVEPCAGCDERGGEPFCGHTVTANVRKSLTCTAGCGDLYWGEWTYDPPKDCDPCNNHGDWVGQQCCPPRGWVHLWNGLHGSRHGGCDCAGGCSDCTTPSEMEWQGETIHELEPLNEIPTPDPELSGVKESEPTPYYSRNPQSRLIRHKKR